jgi:hypothetical protein
MASFSRRTILAAIDLITRRSHAEIDRLLLEYGLEKSVDGASKLDRANSLAAYLIDNPQKGTEDGENLTDVMVTTLVNYAIGQSFGVTCPPSLVQG